MYKEELDEDIARSILGSDYVQGLRYNLLSDRDKFVVSGYDNDGKQIVEVSLDTDEPCDDFEDFEEHVELPKQKREFPFGTLIVCILSTICIASIAAVCVLMYMRR